MLHNFSFFVCLLDRGGQFNGKLTADLSEDVSSHKIQFIVYELLQFKQKNSTSVSFDKPYVNVLIDIYSNDYIKSITDSKYGKGASDYIVKAFHYYSGNNALENN